jgi:hypothetical protein
MKRMLVISDLHCGHVAGLTPPSWQLQLTGSKGKHNKFARSQREAWDWYASRIELYQPFDVVVLNGDAVDGKGPKSGGTEQLTSDRIEQCDIAEECLRLMLGKPTSLIMTYGTPYHTGVNEDWENVLADRLKADKIGSQEWVQLYDTVFDFRHHIESSSIPHGRHTAAAKEDLWNAVLAGDGIVPRADVIIRSHVHYFKYAGDERRLYMTTPALQTMGTKFGGRRCSGKVSFGFVVFEVDKDGYHWYPEVEILEAEKSAPIKVK